MKTKQMKNQGEGGKKQMKERKVKEKMKRLNEQGITLVALVVTIIIMLILAGVALNAVLGDNGLIGKTKQAVEKYKKAQSEEEETLEQYEKDINNLDNVVNNDKQVNRPTISDGMIPIKYDEENKKWVITNEYDDEWYDYKDTSNLKWANMMLSDGKYKASEKNNTEAEGGYKDDGTVEVELNELGSMFVWIPRYAYSFNSYHTEMNIKDETNAEIEGITKISFLRGTSNTDFEGKTYNKSYKTNLKTEDPAGDVEVGKPTPMIVHPGFTFGGKELTGIWVAKFEASMTGTNLNTKENNNKVTQNTILDANCVKISPNAETWRNINIGNAFMNCYNMNGNGNIYELNKNKEDSHLIKNVEWGVVAYLSSSQYGYIPTINTSGIETNGKSESEFHSYTGAQNYQSNISQSTTNNITGIYDLSGGSWELVAGYYDNQSGFLKINGTGVFNDNSTLKSEYTKYWDKYEVGEDEKNGIDLLQQDYTHNDEFKEVTMKRYQLLKGYLGDAMYELINENNYSYRGKTVDNKEAHINIKDESSTNSILGAGYYNQDYFLMGICRYCFVMRGACYIDGTGAGIFATHTEGGHPDYRCHAFRPVIVV